MNETKPVKATSLDAPVGSTNYPAEFASVVSGRRKRKLGDLYGLTNFGVNLTELKPGSASALAHYHSKQDEFIYILAGTVTLILGDDEFELTAGECVGFKAGVGVPHQLSNRSSETVTYLEIGDRRPGDSVVYPNDDLRANMTENGWAFSRKNGTPYQK